MECVICNGEIEGKYCSECGTEYFIHCNSYFPSISCRVIVEYDSEMDSPTMIYYCPHCKSEIKRELMPHGTTHGIVHDYSIEYSRSLNK